MSRNSSKTKKSKKRQLSSDESEDFPLEVDLPKTKMKKKKLISNPVVVTKKQKRKITVNTFPTINWKKSIEVKFLYSSYYILNSTIT